MSIDLKKSLFMYIMIILDCYQILLSFLEIYDIKSLDYLSVITHDNNKYYKNQIRAIQMKYFYSYILPDIYVNYDNFIIKLNKYNFSNKYLDKLLIYIFENASKKTIWKDRQCGYIDIRYLFEVVNIGGRYSAKNIKDGNLSKLIYDIYYTDIIQILKSTRKETIISLKNKPSLWGLYPSFKPYPKNAYNIQYKFLV